jgi:hypothetical protein
MGQAEFIGESILTEEIERNIAQLLEMWPNKASHLSVFQWDRLSRLLIMTAYNLYTRFSVHIHLNYHCLTVRPPEKIFNR